MQRTPCLVVLAMVASAALIASCGKPEPPPPPAPKVEAPKVVAPVVDEQLKRLAAEVYVYAYPLVLTDVTREMQTAKVPTDVFTHKRALPDTSTTDANPNADFLYSQAWLDLSKEPVVLTVPDTRGRYYLIALLDAWTNVAASLGKRTTGTEKSDFAIVGPAWKGQLPAGVSEVKSPTDMAWLFGRVQSDPRADNATAARIQDQFRLAPLSQWVKKSAKPAGAAPVVVTDTKTDARDQVAAMDAATFFTRVAKLLPRNPPAKDDAPMVDKMKKLGVVAGQPFDLTKLDAIAVKSVQDGTKSAHDAIAMAAKGTSADIRNGWTIDRDLGRWGVDYGKRAVNAWRALGVNAPEDATFMSARFDGSGHRLNGANRYVLHFDRGNVPPTDGFWSLSLYDDKQHFSANPINRYSIRGSEDLKLGSDGSISIYIQNTDPGKDKESNWLPAPKGEFNLILRVYWPKQEVLDGRWIPPGIRGAT